MKVTVNVASGGPSGYGFQLTALTVSNNTPLSGYSNLGTNVKQKAVTIGSFAGRTYLEQNGVTTNNQFTFRWTAPATYSGSIRFYSSGNAVNNNGSDAGDRSGTGTLTLLPALSATYTSTNPACSNLSTGSINVTVVGGVSPFTFLWNDNALTEDRSNLAANTYSVLITDAAGQQFNLNNISISASSTPPVIATTTTNATIAGMNNGSAQVSAAVPNGGSMTYQITSSNGYANTFITSNSNSTLSNLYAGTYQVVATNNFGCSSTSTFTITEPTVLLNSVSIQQPTCFGETGHVVLTTTGGLPPYTYLWSNSLSGGDIFLPAGNYTVSITDQGGAVINENVAIISPDEFVAQLTGNDINCNGSATPIDVVLSGGVPPYQNFNPISVSAPGIYSYTFTDSQNCTTTSSIQINALDAFVVVANTFNPTCYGACNGYVQLTINGGVEPFNSVWSNGGDGSNLCAGSYDLQIQDGSGCTQNFGFVLENPDSLYAVSSIQHVSCSGYLDGSVFVQPQGGNGNYTLMWNGDPFSNLNSIIYLAAGNYYLDLTDGNGCSHHYDYVITEPTPLSYTIDSFINGGLGVGEVQMTTFGGTPPYSFQWSSGQTEEDPFLPINSTNYCTITDNNGCSVVTTDFITYDSVDELEENAVALFPNPANTQVKLQSESAIEQLLVVSYFGELIAKYNQLGNHYTLDTSALPAGVYSIRIYAGGNWTSLKLAVQH
jgi:hypothetical protein